MNSESRPTKSDLRESIDVIVFFMASVPFEMFGAQTKNTHWDTDAVFVQYQSGRQPTPSTATSPTAPPWGKYILKDVGFKIVECNLKKKCTPAKFTSHVNSLSRDGELHGIFFYGHGRGTKGFGPKHGGYVKYADLNLHYQLAIAWLMACGTDCMDARALVSQDGLFDGCRGIQWPFFGDQLKGTREDLLEMGSRFEDDCD